MGDRRAERDRPTDGRPERDRSRSGRKSNPARQTEAARSNRRGSWYGHGQRTTAEKDPVGVFLDDVTYAFADVSFLSAPTLVFAWLTPQSQWFGHKGVLLVAWMTMVFGAALIRGGWVRPPATDADGWVALTPWLVALRLGYYNAVLMAAMLGGSAVEAAVSPLASAAFALAVGALAVGFFPRVAEAFYGVVSE